MPNFSTAFSKLFSIISRYDSPIALPYTRIKLPTPDDEKQTLTLDITTTMLDNKYGALGFELLLRRTPHYHLFIGPKEAEFTLIRPTHLILEVQRLLSTGFSIFQTFASIYLIYIRFFTSDTSI